MSFDAGDEKGLFIMFEENKEGKSFEVTANFDVERIVTNEGAARRLSVVVKMFKDTVMKLAAKKILILADWLVKWCLYLKNEESFEPQNLKAYKQREIILVDFGFNIGSEFGGRHYAVVLERDNNPSNSMILVAPITSYDPEKGCHRASFDLGVGFINNHDKGAAVVLNQIRYISKMRIEAPRTSDEGTRRMEKSLFNELIKRVQRKLLS